MSVRVAVVALAGLFLSVSPLVAQDLQGPANLPPAGFTGQQFVDNAGCAFARAGVSGNTVWVARVNQQRQQICGLAPSFGPTAVAAAPARPAADPGPPIPTVASTTPVTARPAAAPSAAPRPAAVTTAPEPRRYSLAQACEGRTGVQPGLIDTRTGLPINCGSPAPVAVAAPAPAAPAAPAPRTLTLAEACAEQAARGVTLINATTGAPVACPAAPTVMAAATAPVPALRPAPSYTTATVAATVAAQTRLDPLSAATLSGRVAPGQVTPVRVGDVLSAETISGVVTQIHYGPPPGYEAVWTDGRINPNRGLPEIQAQVPVAAQPAAADRVSTMTAPAPQAVATGGFVQVGIYGDPANAARAEATLRGLGLPVTMSTVTRDGRALQVVAAGPIAATDLDAALRATRAAGYGDAYIR
jgi:hypothetical protein